MAKKKNDDETTALTTTGPTALAAADELADVLGDDDQLESDGLEEVGAEDLKIAAKVFNMKGRDADGEPIMPNVFFDTVTEQVQKRITGTLLTLQKSNAWTEFDNAEDRNKTICRSADRVTGTLLETGEQRKCEGCPDAQWRNVDGKRTRNCGPVYTVVGIEQASQQPFVLRCKKTSLPPLQQYLNRFFLGRRVVNGKRSNYPLFAFETEIGLEMDDSGKYSMPTFTRGSVLPRAQIMQYAGEAKFFREVVQPLMSKMDAVEDTSSGAGGSAGGDDFIDDDDAPPPPPDGAQQGSIPF